MGVKKSRVVFWALPLLLGLWLAGLPGALAAAEGRQLAWKGSSSNQTEAFSKVVETPEEWSELWRRAFDRPAPAVHFETQVVACVFLGHSADWLYSIGFDAPRRRGDVWVIVYGLHPLILELAKPFKAGGQYHMKVYERIQGAKMILEAEPPSLLGR
jgi:hypothetical protein